MDSKKYVNFFVNVFSTTLKRILLTPTDLNFLYSLIIQALGNFTILYSLKLFGYCPVVIIIFTNSESRFQCSEFRDLMQFKVMVSVPYEKSEPLASKIRGLIFPKKTDELIDSSKSKSNFSESLSRSVYTGITQFKGVYYQLRF